MKEIYLVRHAKAEDHSWVKKDYDRNIIDKGIKRSTEIATLLSKQISIDDKTLVVSSSANRAIQTAKLFCEILDFPTQNIIQTSNIYEAYFKEILKEINQIENDIHTIFVFGHNPGLSDLINYLTHEYINLKTSAVAHIKLENGLNFSELSGGTANLVKVYSE